MKRHRAGGKEKMKRLKETKVGTTWPAARPLAAESSAPPWFVRLLSVCLLARGEPSLPGRARSWALPSKRSMFWVTHCSSLSTRHGRAGHWIKLFKWQLSRTKRNGVMLSS